ncbi:MAG TPA: ABC transporter ATP-binding protein [Acholeplasmatales bacterium]|nr:ABC transporter ATP-binding protein [Acholeplasmatales bacterium]
MANEELFDEESFTSQKIDFKAWKKILSFLAPLKKWVILSIAAMAVLASTDVLFPLLTTYAIDEVIPALLAGTADVRTEVLRFIGFYLIFMVVQGSMVYLFIVWAAKVQTELAYTIRKKAFRHLQELPFSYYDKTRTGWIMARMTSDSRNLSDILSWGVIDLTWGVFMMIILIVVMFVINVKLALITVSVLPILAIISGLFRKYMLKAHRATRKINSKITGAYNEGITGALTTKTLVLEAPNFRDFNALTTDMRTQSIRAAVIQGLYFPTVIFLIAIFTSIVYYAGGSMVLAGGLTIGTLVLFTGYVWQFFEPVNNIADIYARIQQAQASVERVVSLMEAKADITDTPEVEAKYGTLFDYKRENFETLKGDVEFRHVTFKYAVGEKILSDFSLKVKAGESIALVGHTGAGKTTIVKLLMRFYDVNEGTILIDGTDIRSFKRNDLRSLFGMVLQDTWLCNDTIRENIRYGRLDATDAEVEDAAAIAQIDHYVRTLPEGYDTILNEESSNISSGQKQLLTIARAVLANPKMLILDEATSSVDTRMEIQIQKAMDHLMQNRTSFIIAHRLSTIKNADKILVMNHGDIVEIGTHQELLDKNGFYASLYDSQFDHVSAMPAAAAEAL